MNLTLYSSVARSNEPKLVAVQDDIFDGLPTVLVCPIKRQMPRTAFRVEVQWGEVVFVACPDLTRPIRRTALQAIGLLDEPTSQEIIYQLRRLLAQ